MAVVSKYKKCAYFATSIPVLMSFSCIAMFYIFTGSLTGDGYVRTSFWLSFMLLFLPFIAADALFLRFALYSNYKKLKVRMLGFLDNRREDIIQRI